MIINESIFRLSVPLTNSLNAVNKRYSAEKLEKRTSYGLHISPHLVHNNPHLTHSMTHRELLNDSRGFFMASIIKHRSGWRALVNKQGIRKSKIFTSKTAAKDWAAKIEFDIGEGKDRLNSNRTLADLLERYRDTESVKKRSYKWEYKKIDHLLSIMKAVNLSDMNAPYFAEWRNTRLESVSSGTVNREWNLLSAAINKAVKEWEWLDRNPMTLVQRPPKPQSRDRLITTKEIELISHTTSFKDCPNTVQSRVGAAFLFAIETAMRAGEIVSLKPDRINLDNRTADLPITKNGTRRTVPLSTRAIELLELVNCDFDLTSRQIDSNFRKCRDMALIKDLHFHDSRHQAITNLAQKVEVLDLARITGIKDLKILMVYYNQSASEIAKLLD